MLKYTALSITEAVTKMFNISISLAHQWGFCKGKSTAGALALAVDQWHRHLEESNDICTACSLTTGKPSTQFHTETSCLNWSPLALTRMYSDG